MSGHQKSSRSDSLWALVTRIIVEPPLFNVFLEKIGRAMKRRRYWICTAFFAMSTSIANAKNWFTYSTQGSILRAIDLDSFQKISSLEVQYLFRFTNPVSERIAVIISHCGFRTRRETGDRAAIVESGSSNEIELNLACAKLNGSPADPFPAPNPGTSTSNVAASRTRVVSTGTGFFVSSRGHLITNQHVVKGCSAIDVFVEGRLSAAQVIDIDESMDLAILKVSEPSRTFPLVLSNSQPQLGESIVALGYPLSQVLGPELKISSGIVSATSGIRGNRSYVQISAPVQPGNSGGPLLDMSGNVVGVVNARLAERFKAENVNFAIKSSVIRSFLEVNSLPQVAQGALAKPLLLPQLV